MAFSDLPPMCPAHVGATPSPWEALPPSDISRSFPWLTRVPSRGAVSFTHVALPHSHLPAVRSSVPAGSLSDGSSHLALGMWGHPAASLSPHFQGFSLAVSPPWHGNGDGKWGIRNLNAVCLACYVLLICLHESDGVFHSWVLIEA